MTVEFYKGLLAQVSEGREALRNAGEEADGTI
jgi:hypothetical protein